MSRPVAVKLFDDVPSDEYEPLLSTLARVASGAAWLQHPNIVAPFDCGACDGRPFVLTEMVHGVALRSLFDRMAEWGGRLHFDLALFIGCEVAEALTGALVAVGDRGEGLRIIHGELSAREVMLSWAGEVKVTDFGMYRVRCARSGVRSLRDVASRLDALAPEVALGDPPTARSDVFSLGMVLREMFVGPRFTRRVSSAEALQRLRQGLADTPVFRRRLPPALDELLLKATAVDPVERFGSARTLAVELRRIAFLHGVGDGRPFLRRTLEREFPEAVIPQTSDALDEDDPDDYGGDCSDEDTEMAGVGGDHEVEPGFDAEATVNLRGDDF